MKQWFEWVTTLCQIIEDMYKRPYTVPMLEGWIKMVRIKEAAEALTKKEEPMERCPKCHLMTAETNHNTGNLICYNRNCDYEEEREKACIGRGYYRSDCPCPSCRAYMQGREDAKKD